MYLPDFEQLRPGYSRLVRIRILLDYLLQEETRARLIVEIEEG